MASVNNYYGQQPIVRQTCLRLDADGNVVHGSCDSMPPVIQTARPVIVTTPTVVPAVTPAVAAPAQETNWLLIAALAAGIYLLTKG